ncbi:MAG: chemotaxis protein CheX [Synergistaceae bacterium]|nr:chemotaxis protein CheX [Synergistaceae bacterium]
MNGFSSAQLGFIFAGALAEVISTTSGLSLDISSLEGGADFDEMVGIMSLNGKNNGIIFISAEERAMRVLYSFMTGVSEDEVTKDDIDDALCEIVNMTAGSAKQRFNDAEQIFALSPPFVISGKNMSLITKKRVHVISKVLGNGEISVKLKVIF